MSEKCQKEYDMRHGVDIFVTSPRHQVLYTPQTDSPRSIADNNIIILYYIYIASFHIISSRSLRRRRHTIYAYRHKCEVCWLGVSATIYDDTKSRIRSQHNFSVLNWPWSIIHRPMLQRVLVSDIFSNMPRRSSESIHAWR